MPNVKLHADFFLSGTDAQRIDEIVEKNKTTKCEILRKALALYLIASEASSKNLKLGLYNEAGIVKTKIVGF